MHEFKSSEDIFKYLDRFINLEAGYTPPCMRSERMQIICECAGNPQNCAPAIHVAGSKGKGSVTSMISRILEEHGLRVARFISPHINDYRERISCGNNFFDESVYLEAGDKLKHITDILCCKDSREYSLMRAVSIDDNPENPAAPEPTYFELLTLFYFLCAKEANVAALAVETGMGGRLDPTNIVPAIVSVITVIELEHTEFLGSTIESVAEQKAGIIKEGMPCILGAQNFKSALDVLAKKAFEKHAPLCYFPEVLNIGNIHISKDGTDFSVSFKNPHTGRTMFFKEPINMSIGIPGAVQAENAALAIYAAKKAFPAITAAEVRSALKGFKMPARFEKLKETDPVVVVDGAHTEFSVQLCVDTWKNLYGLHEGICIFGCALGKNVISMADSLLSCFDKIIITTPGTFKISNTESIYNTFLERAKKIKKNVEILHIKNTHDAIEKTLQTAKKEGKSVLGVGSFYLAAEIRGFLMRKSPSQIPLKPE